MSALPFLVTGAAGGIGSAIATRLEAAGHEVLRTDLRAPAHDNRFIAARLPDDLDALVAALPARLGGLVHAAGAIHTHRADIIEADVFARLFAINVQAPVALTARLAARLSEGASVVFVGSVAGLRASPGNLIYGASKAALHNAALTFAKTLAPRGIRVNTVCPGLIDTELTERTDRELAAMDGVSVDKVVRRRRDAIPLGRSGTAGEVAAAVQHLVDGATFSTGSQLVLDGGAQL
ncbi:MAG: SDR family oxidoreductase [Acuticoccus sp.]